MASALPAKRKIRILDPDTVTKIAAGEVIERPSSIVKELVENSVDACASSVRIEISSAGGFVTSIRVTDNGSGMSPDDALLAFVPHATSKIALPSDLDHITTLGFRGEALASIAAVTKVTLQTRERGAVTVAGTKVVMEGGQLLSGPDETGTPEGTSILIENVFFNIPARKKFLKKLQTEVSHITAAMEGIALAHPEVALRLIHNGKDLLVTEASPRFRDTVTRIFGTDIIKSMVPVHCQTPLLSISGYISTPEVQRKNPQRILVSINHRFVSSFPITRSIIDAYGSLLPKDRYPVAYLALIVDTRYVDVNVHPAKKLVRLGREDEIRNLVRKAVQRALQQADLIPDIARISPTTSVLTPFRPDVATPRYANAPEEPQGVREATHAGTHLTERQLRLTEPLSGNFQETTILPEMELIGQFGGIYLLAASESGDLIIIDQHAAHERIMYEQLRSRSDAFRISQELIVPVIIERSPGEAAIIRGLLPSLTEEGFVIGEFGRNGFIVSAVPVILGKTEEAAGLIADIVDDLTRIDLMNPATRREEITRIVACRGAIKAGTICTGEQCRRLLQQLARTAQPYTCPHGRPTMVRFSRTRLDSLFKRT